MVVDKRGDAVTRRFRQAHVSRDHGLEHDLAQACANIVGDLSRQAVAPIEHGKRDAEIESSGLKRARMRSWSEGAG
jgi:hypothetical protein